MKNVFTLLISLFLINSVSIGQIASDGFETSEGYAAEFIVRKQGAWGDVNESTIWKDLYSNADASNKAYKTKASGQNRPGSEGSQCLKFELNASAFIPKTEGNKPTLKLRTNDNLPGITLGEKYAIRVWAKTPNSNTEAGKAGISATNGDFQLLESTWKEYVLPFTGLNAKSVQLFFNDIGQDYEVLIDDLSVEVYVPTAIGDDAEIKSLSVYPNPASDKLYVDAEGVIDIVKIYNISGQQVMKAADFSKGIDISGLTKGMYIVSTTIEGKPVQKKFTKR